MMLGPRPLSSSELALKIIKSSWKQISHFTGTLSWSREAAETAHDMVQIWVNHKAAHKDKTARKILYPLIVHIYTYIDFFPFFVPMALAVARNQLQIWKTSYWKKFLKKEEAHTDCIL